MTQDEIDTLVNLGWYFIPDGSLWGLDPEPYMALNSTYACGGESSNGSSGSSSGSQGTVLAAAATSQGGSVLGLADTGDLVTLYGLSVLGFASIILGTLLQKELRG